MSNALERKSKTIFIRVASSWSRTLHAGLLVPLNLSNPISWGWQLRLRWEFNKRICQKIQLTKSYCNRKMHFPNWIKVIFCVALLFFILGQLRNKLSHWTTLIKGCNFGLMMYFGAFKHFIFKLQSVENVDAQAVQK